MNTFDPQDADGAIARAAWLSLRGALRESLRERADVLQPLLFFVVVCSLFPLGLGGDARQLAQSGPALIWICGLLAVLLSLPRIYAGAAQNGTLEQLVLSPYPLAALCAGRMMAHWLLTGLPLTLVAPAIGVAFGLDSASLTVLTLTLALGTPILSMLGALGAALVLGARASAVLIGLLVLPLYVPVLIFGAGAVDAQAAGVDPGGALALLGAGVLFGALLTPFGAAAALRIAME